MMATKWVIKTANGTYTDKFGKEKTSWLTFGKIVEKKNGGLSLKIESIPVEWNGWGQLFDPPEEDDKKQPKSDDSIPF